MESKKKYTPSSYSIIEGKLVTTKMPPNEIKFCKSIQHLIVSLENREEPMEFPLGISFAGYEITITKSK